jgi:hypothetical protein
MYQRGYFYSKKGGESIVSFGHHPKFRYRTILNKSCDYPGPTQSARSSAASVKWVNRISLIDTPTAPTSW